MPTIEFILIGVLLVAIVLTYRMSVHRHDAADWAQRNGLTLLRAKRCWLWCGPFLMDCSNWQRVFRIVIADPKLGERSGWLRINDWPPFDGTVRWDDQPQELTDYPRDFPGGSR